MTSIHARVLVPSVVVIIALGFAFWQDRRLTAATAAFAAGVQEQTALTRELDRLDARARSRSMEWEHARRSANVVLARVVTETTPGADRLTADGLSEEDAHASHAIHATMDLRYRRALERLGVSADAIVRWEEAAIKYNQRMRDIAAAARDQHVALTDPAIAELRRQEIARMMETETAIIGPEAHAEVARLSALTPVTNLVEQVAGMVFAESPLTAAQGEQLTNIIANASPAFRQGHNVVLGAIDWNAVLAQALPMISATQYQALRDIVSDLQTRNELSRHVVALLHPQ